MDRFTGFKTAAAEALPDAAPVMDPFHVVRLGGEALDKCRRRVQQTTLGRRGRTCDPLYGARRTLSTGADLLTDRQYDRLTTLFGPQTHGDTHVEVEATWVNRRLEHLRGSALGFHNLTNYIARSLL